MSEITKAQFLADLAEAEATGQYRPHDVKKGSTLERVLAAACGSGPQSRPYHPAGLRSLEAVHVMSEETMPERLN